MTLGINPSNKKEKKDNHMKQSVGRPPDLKILTSKYLEEVSNHIQQRQSLQ